MIKVKTFFGKNTDELDMEIEEFINQENFVLINMFSHQHNIKYCMTVVYKIEEQNNKTDKL